jgi:hypothetical protein
MVNIEHHHRRIHWKTRLVRWTLAPMALLAAPAWLYFSFGTCQEEGDQLGTACRALRVLPFLPTLGAVLLLAFVAWDLATLGRARAAERGETPRRRGLKHVAHGYREVSATHRRRIHWALATVALVTLAVGLWIAVIAYRSTH